MAGRSVAIGGYLPMKNGAAISFTATSGSTAVALPTAGKALTLLADQAFYFKLGASNVSVTSSVFDGRWLPNVPLNLAAGDAETHIAVLRVSADGTLLLSTRG